MLKLIILSCLRSDEEEKFLFIRQTHRTANFLFRCVHVGAYSTYTSTSHTLATRSSASGVSDRGRRARTSPACLHCLYAERSEDQHPGAGRGSGTVATCQRTLSATATCSAACRHFAASGTSSTDLDLVAMQ